MNGCTVQLADTLNLSGRFVVLLAVFVLVGCDRSTKSGDDDTVTEIPPIASSAPAANEPHHQAGSAAAPYAVPMDSVPSDPRWTADATGDDEQHEPTHSLLPGVPPPDDLLADIQMDFQAGQNGHSDKRGTGQWWYLTSSMPNPSDNGNLLQPMGWDSGTDSVAHFEFAADNDDGYVIWPCIMPAEDRGLKLTPGNRTPRYALVRWVSGEKGQVVIQGWFSKALTEGGDGCEVMVYVDNELQFREQLAFDDAAGKKFVIESQILPESNVDFVVGSLGPRRENTNDWDTTRLVASIIRVSPELQSPYPPAEVQARLDELKASYKPLALDRSAHQSHNDYLSRIRDWWTQQFVAPYQTGGPQQQFDDQAVELLNAFVESVVQGTVSTEFHEKNAKLGSELLQAGCLDPAVVVVASAFGSGNYDPQIVNRCEIALLKIKDTIPSAEIPHVLKAQYYDVLASYVPEELSPEQAEAETQDRWFQMTREYIAAISQPELSDFDRRMLYLFFVRISQRPDFDAFRAYFFAQLRSAEQLNPWLQSILMADEHIRLAWLARGAGFADTVTPTGWFRFTAHINSARLLALDAWFTKPELPEAAGLLITVAMATGGELGEDTRFWLDQAWTAQPLYGPALSKYLWSIRPRWGGSHEEMLAFGRQFLSSELYDTKVPDVYLRVLADISADLSGNYSSILGMPGVYDDVRNLCEGRLTMVTDPEERNRCISILVAAAKLVQDRETFESAFKLLGTNPLPKYQTNFGVDAADLETYLDEIANIDVSLFAAQFSSGPNLLSFSNDGKLLILEQHDWGFTTWHADGDFKLAHRYLPDVPRQTSRKSYQGAVAPDGHLVAAFSTAFGDPRPIIVTDLATRATVQTLNLFETPYCLRFSPDGSAMAVGYSDGSVFVFDTQTWTETHYFKSGIGAHDAHFLPDNSGLVIAFSLADETLWTLPSPGSDRFEEPQQRWKFEPKLKSSDTSRYGIMDLVTRVSPDGRYVFVGGADTYVLDSQSGKLIRVITGRAMGCSPDSKLLVTGGAKLGSTAKIWNIETGAELVSLTGGHKDVITATTFSPDGSAVFTAGHEGKVVRWNALTGKRTSP